MYLFHTNELRTVDSTKELCMYHTKFAVFLPVVENYSESDPAKRACFFLKAPADAIVRQSVPIVSHKTLLTRNLSTYVKIGASAVLRTIRPLASRLPISLSDPAG